MQTARSVGDPNIHELNMLAQKAGCPRHPRPHVAPMLKGAAQTACIQAVAHGNAKSTGDCSAAEARLLVDDHRLPPQKSACESIDGLCKQGTNSEDQISAAGGSCPLRSKLHAMHTGFALRNRVRVFDRGGPHHVSRPDERCQPRSLPTGLDAACPRLPLGSLASFLHTG